MQEARNIILHWMDRQNGPVLFSDMQRELGISIASKAFEGLRSDGVIKAVFPEAKPGDSGRQFWDFAHMMALS